MMVFVKDVRRCTPGGMLVGKVKEFFEKMKMIESYAFSQGWLIALRHGMRSENLMHQVDRNVDIISAEEFMECLVNLCLNMSCL
jgi:hypothetical protein